jgi:TolA-binding protein
VIPIPPVLAKLPLAFWVFRRMISGFRKTYSMNSDQQQHKEGDGMIAFLAWLEADDGRNRKRLIVGAVLLIVVAFAIYIFNYLGESKERTASAALIELRSPPVTAANTNEVPVPASSYLKVADQHSGTAAAERAILLAAGAYFTEGKYAEAQAQFDRLLKESPSSKWAADASYGVAASLESQGKRDEALAAYQRVATAYGTSSVAAEARMAMARIYEAKNQHAEALKQYEDVSRGGMTSMRAQEAIMARNQLLKQHPELDKPATNSMPVVFPSGTNKPAAATTNAAPMTNKPASATNTAAGAK